MTDRHRILLALGDGDEARSFETCLNEAGFDTVISNDGTAALETALAETPSLIIAGMDLPVINGERLFQIIRNTPHTSRVPFLFISSTVADVKGFRTGFDIFLIRPINLEEFQARVRQTLSLKIVGSISKDKDMEGKLSHMPLTDILQFLHLNRKEGELRVSSTEQSGSVYIKDGHIYNAVLGNAEGEKALFRLLLWDSGRFEFIPRPVSILKKIRSSTGAVLMEGMRQIDEIERLKEQFAGRNVLKAKIDREKLPKGLPPVVYEVMRLVAHYPKAEDLVEHSYHTDYEAYKAISSLIVKGAIECRDAVEREEKKASVFLTVEQMIKIREKIIGRSQGHSLSYGKILLLSNSPALVADFIARCRMIPGFKTGIPSAFPQIAMTNPLGESASYRLHGGMDLLLYSIPTIRNMGPLWRAFSVHTAGLVVLWDGRSGEDLKELIAAKKEILSKGKVPCVHVFASGDNEKLRQTLGISGDERIFKAGRNDDEPSIIEVFNALFDSLLKDEHAA